VGIDGYTNSTVEQIGTEQDVVHGTPEYSVWWEMWSTGAQQPAQTITGMTIGPGDSIIALVQYFTSGAHAGDFELSITDNSRSNDSFTTYVSSAKAQNPTAQLTSAEWIVETPSFGNHVGGLANFASVTFTSASATINGVSGPIDDPAWQSQAMNIASDNGALLDTTSVLVNSGSSFTVTYDPPATSENPGPSGSGGHWWGASQEGSVSPGSGSATPSAAQSPVPVLYGTTTPSRKPPFGSARGSLRG